MKVQITVGSLAQSLQPYFQYFSQELAGILAELTNSEQKISLDEGLKSFAVFCYELEGELHKASEGQMKGLKGFLGYQTRNETQRKLAKAAESFGNYANKLYDITTKELQKIYCALPKERQQEIAINKMNFVQTILTSDGTLTFKEVDSQICERLKQKVA